MRREVRLAAVMILLAFLGAFAAQYYTYRLPYRVFGRIEWIQTNWAGGPTHPNIESDNFDNAYARFYSSENVDWENMPGALRLRYAVTGQVGAEPDPLVDGSSRIGWVVAGSGLENTRALDNIFENIVEVDMGGDGYCPVQSETVYEGGTSNFEYAQDDDGRYERIFENSHGGAVTAMVAYSVNTATPQYRIWNGSSWGAQASANATSGSVRWVVLKYARTRNEAMLGTLSTTGDIYVQIWNGSSWSTPKRIANVGTTNYVYRGFDIEYENYRDRAVVVFVPSAGATTLRYSIWDGSSWVVDNAAVPLTLPTTGTIYWVEMAPNPKPDNNDIALIYLEANRLVYGILWNGSTWSNMGVTTAWGTAATATRKCIDVAYEQKSGRAMFIWGDQTAGYQYYRLWDGSTLTSPTSLYIAAMGGVANWVMLAPDPTSNRIMYGVQDAGRDLNTRLWSGSAWDTATQHPEHDSSTEDAADQNFSIAWEIFPGYEGRAWLMWGDGATVSYKEWTGSSWGTAAIISGSDDTARVQLTTHPYTGVIFAVIQEDSTSATDDLSEVHQTTGGGGWSSLFDLWDGPTWANPQTEFAMVACRRDNRYRLDVQHTITGIPSADLYELEIEYYTEGDPNEKVSAYVYNFETSSWEDMGNLFGGSASSPNLFTYKLSPSHISGGEARIRFVQSENDDVRTNLMVDYCRIAYKSTEYRLRWEHRITGISPSSLGTLIICGYSDGDENIGVYLWKGTDDQWVYIDNLENGTPSFITFPLDNTYLEGDNLSIKYEDWDPTDDNSTIIHIDFCVVVQYYPAGWLESSVYDAGEIVEWLAVCWDSSEPWRGKSSPVDLEPDPLVDGSARLGENLDPISKAQTRDGDYQRIREREVLWAEENAYTEGSTDVVRGVVHAGSPDNLDADDDICFEVDSEAVDYKVEIIHDSTDILLPSGYAVDNIVITLSFSSENTASYWLQIYDWNNARWDLLNLGDVGGSKVTWENVITADPENYIGGIPGGGRIRVRMRGIGGSQFRLREDYLMYTLNMTKATFGLRWEHRITGVDLTYPTYRVYIYGYSSPDEAVSIYVWNGENDQWVDTGLDLPTSPGWIRFDVPSSYFEGDNLSIKYEDDNKLDITQTEVYIDFCELQQVSASAALAIKLRSGTDNNPYDGSENWGQWQEFHCCSALPFENRYLQYRVELSTQDNRLAPLLTEIRIGYRRFAHQPVQSEVVVEGFGGELADAQSNDGVYEKLKERMYLGGYRLNIEHHITGIPSGSAYVLEIEYFTVGDSENVELQVWNFATSQWDPVDNLQGGTEEAPQIFTHPIDQDHIAGGEVRVRYLSGNDPTETNLMIDYCRVRIKKT